MQRRNFLKNTAALAGLSLIGTGAIAAPVPATIVGGGSAKDTFKLGCAGFTFNRFKLDKTLEMLKKVDVHYLCIKDFHLPLNSNAEQIAAFHAECAKSEVTGYGVGPIYMDSEDAARNAFEYAKRVGVKVLVGVPTVKGKSEASPELVKFIGKLVQEYDIKYAIHNHGPDMPKLFPTAESAIEIIGNLDKRVGVCLDIGHQLRYGIDPVQTILKHAGRIHDMHIKNVTAADKSGGAIQMSRGKIDIPAVVRALRKVGYTGVCSLEYERDMTDPLLGIAESIGYFRGVMDATR